MACNCFDKVNKNLQEKMGDPLGSLGRIWQLVGNRLVTKPAVIFVYKNKNKDGSTQKKISKIEVTYAFCPFCGKKYEEESEQISEK